MLDKSKLRGSKAGGRWEDQSSDIENPIYCKSPLNQYQSPTQIPKDEEDEPVNEGFTGVANQYARRSLPSHALYEREHIDYVGTERGQEALPF